VKAREACTEGSFLKHTLLLLLLLLSLSRRTQQTKAETSAFPLQAREEKKHSSSIKKACEGRKETKIAEAVRRTVFIV